MKCEIVRRFFGMMEKLGQEQKLPHDYGTGHMLYHSELAFLTSISEMPEMNVSDLSAKLNITKSAVTQTCNKLFEKGLIEKYTKGKNKKEKFFRLTETGKSVKEKHDEYHMDSNEKIKNYLCSLDADSKEVLLGFFDKVEECTSLCVFACSCDKDCGLSISK